MKQAAEDEAIRMALGLSPDNSGSSNSEYNSVVVEVPSEIPESISNTVEQPKKKKIKKSKRRRQKERKNQQLYQTARQPRLTKNSLEFLKRLRKTSLSHPCR